MSIKINKFNKLLMILTTEIKNTKRNVICSDLLNQYNADHNKKCLWPIIQVT